MESLTGSLRSAGSGSKIVIGRGSRIVIGQGSRGVIRIAKTAARIIFIRGIREQIQILVLGGLQFDLASLSVLQL